MDNELKQFYNCKILRNHIIHIEDFWVRNGKIVNPGKIFFDEQIQPDIKIDCEGLTIAPGFIDLQINGGYGVDFSYDVDEIEKGINIVAKGLLENGVTAFCPTIVTSPVPTYRKIIPKIRARQGNSEGASVLGIHAEGPFIDVGKKGAHPSHCIRDFSGGFKSVVSTYGSIENLKIVTLAPELLDSMEVIKQLVESGIVVSLGHSSCNLVQGEEAVRHGASFITHLFNAMLPFHHRDPGLVGLLTSEKIPKPIFYGIISDGIHTHPAALRIAYKTHPDGLILVTDAIAALGLNEGRYHLGQLDIVITDGKAFIAGTDTLCGSICNLNQCVQLFLKFTGCTPEYALEAASLHPAQVLGIDNQKGTLDFDADADFIMVDDLLLVHSTWISGECVYDIKT